MSNALAIVGKPQQEIARGFSDEQIALIKRTIAPDANDNELALFLSQCQRTGLDPFSRQIYFIKRGGKGTTQVSIDGFRVIAERTHEMDGQEVWWCGADGVWRDVWLEKEPPAASRVLVYRKGCTHPFPAIAKFAEYKDSGPMWSKMPANQLAKCAEALALRKAFPHQLSGLYATEEMGQADAPLTLEVTPAPDQPKVELPEGACLITKVKTYSDDKLTWAMVTFVDDKGEQHEKPTVAKPKGELAVLCEQLLQEGKPVMLVVRPGPRGGKEAIREAHRLPLAEGPKAIQDGNTTATGQNTTETSDTQATPLITGDDLRAF